MVCLDTKIIWLDKPTWDRDKAFLRRIGINVQLFALRRRKHGDFEIKTSLTLDEKLEKTICSKTEVLYCSTKQSSNFNKIIKLEMELFDLTGNPSPKIIKLCEALKTIPSKSVEFERAFPDAGLLVTELKTRLGGKSIN
ncbi:uncharacterized protein TNCV_4903861 [Trichonephila clavipes]|nr:uncharacterized protein TNCV_4903861 [Trichonephila clavipes]